MNFMKSESLMQKCNDRNVFTFSYQHVGMLALQWAKWEIVELSVLLSWKEMVKGQIEKRISKLKQNFKQPTGKVLQNADVNACLSDLHNKYVSVPANKAPNNIQQETQPTLHVKCHLKTLSIPMIHS